MKYTFSFLLTFVALFTFSACAQSNNANATANEAKAVAVSVKNTITTNDKTEGDLKWYTWAEAVEAQKVEPRKIFVDVYTDWCGWCKVMDKKTFPDPKVRAYIEKNFYAVKLDAEQKEDIIWEGNKFSWRPAGRKGVHMLAYSLLEGKMSYPTIVYLTEDMERIMISPGYKTPEQFLPELKFASEEHYKNTSWEEYKAKN